jgi:hypothetical protein
MFYYVDPIGILYYYKLVRTMHLFLRAYVNTVDLRTPLRL